MKRTRILVLCLVILALVTLWVLWVTPKAVDMSTFAPTNSLVYLEVNRPLEVTNALQRTEAWQILDKHQTRLPMPSQRGWLQAFIRATGIGPIDSVIMARSQVAVVVTDLVASENDGTLNVKPEAALILETHTAERRIRAPVERALQHLLTNTYGSKEPERSTTDGVHLIEWKREDGTGQVVATFFGSLVIVGNSRRAVNTCLNVVRRRAPSLSSDRELHKTRAEHSSATALAFGYVPASESGRLMSVALPLLLVRAPGDVEFQKLIERATAKLLGSLTWSSRTFKEGIEDRYQISLQPSVVAKLKANRTSIRSSNELPLHRNFYSISRYNFEDPLQAWQSLKAAISGHVDALGAVILNSILKAGLLAYRIEEPETFLGTVQNEITTFRLDEQGDRQLLVAHVRDVSKLITFFETQMAYKKRISAVPGTSIFESSDGNTAVAVNEAVAIIGHPTDVQQYFLSINQSNTNSDQETRQINYYDPPNDASLVTTYTNDTERIGSAFIAMLKVSGANPLVTPQVEADIASLPYSVTVTTLSGSGVERITRSPLGQFSTLISIFSPDGAFPQSKVR